MKLKFSKRRIVLIVISIVLIVGIAFVTFADPEDSDTLILALLGMFVLGILQLLSAVAGTMRGSKFQGMYLFASIAYLIYYVGCVMEYFAVPDLGMDGTYLGILGSLVLATAYVLILLFDRTKPEQPMLRPEDELLDDL